MTRFRGKRGTTCLFLAIILSALILVEVTYLQLVLELDRKLTYDRGVRLALETYLADYNRQLFDVYGLYAFDVEGIDDEVYRSVLAASGISEDSILVVSGMDTFDEDDLQRAINIYCTYRSSGMLFSFFGDQIVDLLEKIDDLGILESLSDFMSNGFHDYLPARCFSHAQAAARVSSIGRSAFQPISVFARVGSAQMAMTSPGLRGTNL